MSKEKVILWDFDGTLAYRPGMWSGVLAEVLLENAPNCKVTADDFRPFLRNGFPWHRPKIPHTELNAPELWWAEIEKLLVRAYMGVGLSLSKSKKLARLAHQKYIDPNGWFLYEDVIPTLKSLANYGWRHVILSNHVPELSIIVDGIGLKPYISKVITSALTGYEKPNPKAFINALEQIGNPEVIWMIGDNIEADIIGVEAVGIKGILVREEDKRAVRYCADLYRIPSIIEAQTSQKMSQGVRS